MSNVNSLQINCPVCTVINEVNLLNLIDNIYCQTCSSQLILPNDETLNQITEANNKERIIEDNYIKAYEEIPSSFIPSEMIFLKAKIKNHDVRFLVDTGAQVSILPLYLVKVCQVEDILDQRFAGQLKGVGSDRIMGKIHYLEVELSCGIIPCSFTICENNSMEPILGIDMMQQMGLILDFKSRTIKIGDSNISMN